MYTLCVICARTGSKGVKNKNFLKIKGKSLIRHTLDFAVKSKIFDYIAVSVDKKKISLGKNSSKTIFIQRPKKLAKSSSNKLDAIRHAVKFCEKETKKNFFYIFDLDVTSPLRNLKDLKNAFKKFKKENASNLFSVTPSRKNPYFNMIEIRKKKVKLINPSKNLIHNRQKAPKTFDMNASIYIWKKKSLFKTNNLFNKKTSIFIMPLERSIDIDSDFDLKLVKKLLK